MKWKGEVEGSGEDARIPLSTSRRTRCRFGAVRMFAEEWVINQCNHAFPKRILRDLAKKEFPGPSRESENETEQKRERNQERYIQCIGSNMYVEDSEDEEKGANGTLMRTRDQLRTCKRECAMSVAVEECLPKKGLLEWVRERGAGKA